MVDLSNDRTDTYLHAIKQEVNPKLQLVVAIFPTSRDDRYSAFKKLCCIESPIPSQVTGYQVAVSLGTGWACPWGLGGRVLGDWISGELEVCFSAGYQCSHNHATAEVTQCYPKDCFANQLQVRRRALGSGDPCGEYRVIHVGVWSSLWGCGPVLVL